MLLYAWKNESGTMSSLSISKNVIPVDKSISGKGPKTTAILQNVQLHYLGLQLDNNYTVLDALSSLVKLFLRNQFGQKIRAIRDYAYFEGQWITLTAERVRQENGRQPLLRLHIEGSEERAKLYMVNVWQLDSALHKAMNWIAPEAEIKK